MRQLVSPTVTASPAGTGWPPPPLGEASAFSLGLASSLGDGSALGSGVGVGTGSVGVGTGSVGVGSGVLVGSSVGADVGVGSGVLVGATVAVGGGGEVAVGACAASVACTCACTVAWRSAALGPLGVPQAARRITVRASGTVRRRTNIFFSFLANEINCFVVKHWKTVKQHPLFSQVQLKMLLFLQKLF